VEAVAADIILLLNTDVQPEVGFLAPLLKAMEADDVFAAAPRVRRPEQGGVAESAIGAEFRRGLFRLKFLGDAPFEEHSEPFPTLYAVGAAAAMRRQLFLDLGGMDPLYAPYYWEDVDLGYQAWKAGYRVLCVPESIVEHYSGTISATQPGGRIAMAQGAHRFLFTWKNVHDPWWTLSHWLWLAPHCLAALVRGQASFVGELRAALARLPEALAGRRAARARARLTDAEVLRRVGGGAGEGYAAASGP
jgi:GT2 family glycosyltransferase